MLKCCTYLCMLFDIDVLLHTVENELFISMKQLAFVYSIQDTKHELLAGLFCFFNRGKFDFPLTCECRLRHASSLDQAIFVAAKILYKNEFVSLKINSWAENEKMSYLYMIKDYGHHVSDSFKCVQFIWSCLLKVHQKCNNMDC